MNTDLTQVEDVILEKLNQICGKFGLNNIMAQLYATLYLKGRPMSLNEMVERLNISKGSVSVNIRALERYGAVRQVWVKGSRKDYYEAEADIAKVIMERIKSMASRRLSEVDEMVSSSYSVMDAINGNDDSEDESVKIFKERLERLKNLYEQAKSMYELFNTFLIDKSFASAVAETNGVKV